VQSELSKPDWKQTLRNIIDSVPYEFCVNLLSILNLVSLLIRDLNSDTGTGFIKAWIYYQIVINTFFFIEMITEWLVFGFFHAYRSSFRCWSETLS